MAERSMRAAGFWPRRTVRVATRVLSGATRGRYRQEFLAELYGLGRARQLRHALGVLSRCWALRDAINTPSPAAAADMEIVFPRRPRPRAQPTGSSAAAPAAPDSPDSRAVALRSDRANRPQPAGPHRLPGRLS